MNYEEQKKQAIIDYLKGLHIDNLISLYNEYASSVGNELIFSNDEPTLNDIFNGDVMSAIRAVCYGHYNYVDDYVMFNGYGNLDTFNKYQIKDHIDFDELADWVIRECPREIAESLEEILPDVFKSLLENDGVSMDDEDIVDSVISGYYIIDDDWDEIVDEVKKEIEAYYKKEK